MKAATLLILVYLIFGCDSKQKGRKERDYALTNEFPVRDSFLSKYFFDASLDLLQLDVGSFTNHQIDSLLKSLLRSDQKYRELIIETRTQESENQIALGDLYTKMERTDSINYIVLNRIIQNIGWPNNRVFSDSAINASFFVTLHHRGNDLSYLTPLIDQSFSRNEISNDHYAILTDRVLLRNGKSQKFGTHCRMTRDGSVDFISLSDTTGINKNRREIGLGLLNWTTCDLVKY